MISLCIPYIGMKNDPIFSSTVTSPNFSTLQFWRSHVFKYSYHKQASPLKLAYHDYACPNIFLLDFAWLFPKLNIFKGSLLIFPKLKWFRGTTTTPSLMGFPTKTTPSPMGLPTKTPNGAPETTCFGPGFCWINAPCGRQLSASADLDPSPKQRWVLDFPDASVQAVAGMRMGWLTTDDFPQKKTLRVKEHLKKPFLVVWGSDFAKMGFQKPSIKMPRWGKQPYLKDQHIFKIIWIEYRHYIEW